MALEAEPYHGLESPFAVADRIAFEDVPADETRAPAGALRNPLAGVVAVVGCDGSGKTTLTNDLVASLRTHGPVVHHYMGLISGETGDKIKRLPVIGVRIERYFAAKARRAQDMKKKLPSTFAAVVMYLLSVWRVFQMRRLIRLSESGVLVVADRYPQAEIPGFHYDGPGLTAHRTQNWLIRKLAAREQKLYEWMAEQRPALIIRLNVDVDTAFARKSDHPLAELRDKIETMPRIAYNGATLREIDASMPYPQVLDSALQAISAAVPS